MLHPKTYNHTPRHQANNPTSDSHPNSVRELREVRRPQPSNGIPSLPRREPTRPAPRVRPSHDVVEGSLSRARVQEWVEEPKRALALCRETVVEERNDGREHGCRRGRAVEQRRLAPYDHLVRDALRGDVRVRPARDVVQALVCAITE